MNMSKVANCFWQGESLGLHNYICLSSLVQAGFALNVYSYNQVLSVPPGAELIDASLIMPATELGRYTQAGMPANLAAFSDMFRVRLLSDTGGWWFDVDVLCLAEAEIFVRLVNTKRKRVAYGYEDETYIASGVLYIEDHDLLNALLREVELMGDSFSWGAIGPKLLTRMLPELGYEQYADPPSTYYPIHFSDYPKMLLPEWKSWCNDKVAGSLALHLWNEVRRRYAIPIDLMPPRGSFLQELFIKVCPYLEATPCMDRGLVDRLIAYEDTQTEYGRLLSYWERAKSLPFVGFVLGLERRAYARWGKHGA